MNTVHVKTIGKDYEIRIESSFAGLKAVFENSGLSGKKIMCIADSNVSKIYLNDISEILKPLCKHFEAFVFPAGEESKNLDMVKDIYAKLMECGFERSSGIIALGGGVTGDLAGFAASTYMRGIQFAQIPTSLLAQVDSSVGGKVGVDFSGAKNMVGAFYQPEFVYINTATLGTLPKEQFISGMGEVIKYGAIYDKEFLRLLAENADNIISLNNRMLAEIIRRSIQIKAEVVGQDEKEKGLREILNFGHTFGHAIESLSGYSLPHGVCVGLGMVCAANLSCQKGYISHNESNEFVELLKRYKLPLSISGFDVEMLLDMTKKDKKVKDSKLTVILLERMGKAFSAHNISRQEMAEAFRQIIK